MVKMLLLPFVVVLMGLNCALAAPVDFDEVTVVEFAQPEVRDPNNGSLVFTDHGTVIVGDMELDLHRNGVLNPNSRWPHGQVPYVISGTYSAGSHNTIIEALRELEHDVNGPGGTCIQFVTRTSQTTYIDITPGTGCHSPVGYANNGRREVSIGNGCQYKGIIMHELIHTLGFWHEHNRVDRDSYINIDLRNVATSSQHDFTITTTATATTLRTAYDFNSIMHYSPYDFAIDARKPVITAKPGKAPVNAQLGQRISLSPTDVLKIQRLYGCREDTTHITQPATQVKCPFENSICNLVTESSPTYRFAYGKAATAAGPYAGNTNGADSFLVIHEVAGHTGVINIHTPTFHSGNICIQFYLYQKGPTSYLNLIYKGPTLATTVFKSFQNTNKAAWVQNKQNLNVPTGVQFTITFQAHMAAGDIAIDDVYIYNGHCV